MVTPNSCCTTVMVTVPEVPNAVKSISRLSEKTPLTRSPRNEEDTTSPKEYGLVQGRRVMFSLKGTANPEKEDINEHCKLRQSSEMVQSPEVARDKVWFLRLSSESHIWDRGTRGGQVGGSSGGDGEGDGEDEGGGDSEGESDGDRDGDGEGESDGDRDGDGEDEGGGDSEGESDGDRDGDGEGESDGDRDGDGEDEGGGDGEGESDGD